MADWLMGPARDDDPPTLIPAGGDSMDVTSELATREALQDLARYARGPRGQPPACLLLYLWNEDGQYDTRYLNAGLKVSEIIALLEIVKGKFLQQINNPVEPDEDDKNEGDATN